MQRMWGRCVSVYKLHKVLAKQTWYPARELFGQLLQLIVDATI